MRKILIAQPTRMHAHQLALAFVEGGYDVFFHTLLPDAPRAGQSGRWRRSLSSRFEHNRLDFLPAGRTKCWPGPLVLQKLTFNSKSLSVSRAGEWAAWALFDRWVARSVAQMRPDLVIGYERSSALTYSVCQRLDIPCVLDAAAEHYSLQQRWLEEEREAARTWAGRRLIDRKQQEIVGADLIMTCSPQAKQSYIDAGVADEKVTVNPLGVDLTAFDQPSQRRGSPKFLFVGNPLPYKGLDRLLGCFSNVAADFPGAVLNVVGDTGRHLSTRHDPWLVLRGKLSHTELAALMSEMDYLVMPSRLESFGLVALEALASGMSVLISERVGIGGVLPNSGVCTRFSAEDDADLENVLRAACARTEHARSLDGESRNLAAGFGWRTYRARARALLEPLLAVGASPA